MGALIDEKPFKSAENARNALTTDTIAIEHQ
jgi:hypothetical protein